MTLDTRFIIDHPVSAEKVFHHARAMIDAREHYTWTHETKPGSWLNPHYRNDPGQGLPAWLYVHYGADGPLLERKYDESGIEEIGVKPHDPPGFVEVSMDTAYGYKDNLGRGCGQLHATYVSVLGRWCESNGWPYHWQNEFSGEWFTDWRVAAVELGNSGDEASDWFTSTVMPAITALDTPDHA